jgi:hypothetical protein
MKKFLWLAIAVVIVFAVSGPLFWALPEASAGGGNRTPKITNLGVAVLEVFGDGHLTAFAVRESTTAGDLNGDGDLNDFVAHVYDLRTGHLYNLGLASSRAIYVDLKTHSVIVLVQEQSQGNADLNGDGDTTDTVLHVVDVPHQR